MNAIAQAAGYPLEAMSAQLRSGNVVVGFTITPDGSVENAAALESSNLAFVPSAIEMTKQLKCSPRAKIGRAHV